MFFVQAALSKVGKKPLLGSGNRCLTIKTKKEMKKNLFVVAAVALVALVSCNKETNSPLQPAPVSDIKFEAEFVNEQTKTSIGEADENGYRNVTWDLGELVHINGTLFKATGHKEDGKAIFETENLDFATAEQYNAIYPASAGKSLDAVTIPAAQDGTFANAAIAVAQSENRSLAFMNVASLIKFQVPAAYSKVTIESTANLAGAVSVSFNEAGVPVIGEVTNASKKITLENVKAGVDYYVAILSGDHKFTFRFDGYLSKASNTSLSASRAEILNLGVLPELETFTWGIVGQHQDWTITNPTPMYKVADKVYAVFNVTLKDNGFKFAKTGLQDWKTDNTYFGAWKKSSSKGYFDFSTEMGKGAWYNVYTNNLGGQAENIGVSDFSKKYDIYVKVVTDADWGQELGYTVVETGTVVTF